MDATQETKAPDTLDLIELAARAEIRREWMAAARLYDDAALSLARQGFATGVSVWRGVRNLRDDAHRCRATYHGRGPVSR